MPSGGGRLLVQSRLQWFGVQARSSSSDGRRVLIFLIKIFTTSSWIGSCRSGVPPLPVVFVGLRPFVMLLLPAALIPPRLCCVALRLVSKVNGVKSLQDNHRKWLIARGKTWSVEDLETTLVETRLSSKVQKVPVVWKNTAADPREWRSWSHQSGKTLELSQIAILRTVKGFCKWCYNSRRDRDREREDL